MLGLGEASPIANDHEEPTPKKVERGKKDGWKNNVVSRNTIYARRG
jgi:hypothetical protein